MKNCKATNNKLYLF